MSARYRAFISYSRANRTQAMRLQRQLERFVLPSALREVSPGTKRDAHPLRPVFRDEDELVPGPDLPARIERALRESEYLVVVCSPAAARSEWVDKEVRAFIALHGADRVLMVVVAGEPDAAARGLDAALECLPPTLRVGRSTVGGDAAPASTSKAAAESLWVDWRADAANDRRVFLRVVAALLSLSSLDDLVRRDAAYRRQQRALRWAAGTVAAIGVIVAVALVSWQVRERAIARSNALAELAQRALNAADVEGAARYALLAMHGADRRFIGFDPAAAERVLQNAIVSNRRIGAPVQAAPADWLHALSADARVAAFVSPDGTLRLWDVRAGRPLAADVLTTSGTSMLALSADASRLAVLRGVGDGYEIELWDVRRVERTAMLSNRKGDRFVGGSGRVDLQVAAFSLEADKIVVGGRWGGVFVHLWKIATATHDDVAIDSPDTSLGSVAFSPQGDRVAVGTDYSGTLVYGVPGMAKTRGPGLVGGQGQRAVTFWEDPRRGGASLLIGTKAGALLDWFGDFDEPLLEEKQVGSDAIRALPSPRVAEFDTGVVAVVARAWTDPYQRIDLFPGGTAAMPNGAEELVTIDQGQVRRWRPFVEPRAVRLPGADGDAGVDCTSWALLPHRAMYARCGGGRIAEVDPETLVLRKWIRVEGADDWPEPVRSDTPLVTPDGRWLIVGSRGALWRVDLATGAPTRLTDAFAGAGLAAISADGATLAAVVRAGGDRDAWSLASWDLSSGRPRNAPVHLLGEPTNLAVLPEGAEVLLMSLAVSPGGAEVLLMSHDAPPRWLELSSGASRPAPFPGYGRAIFSRDGTVVMTAGREDPYAGPMQAYDVATGAPLAHASQRLRDGAINEDPALQEWARELSFERLISAGVRVPPLRDDGDYVTEPRRYWLDATARHLDFLGVDGIVYRWELGPAFGLRGRALAAEACRVVLPGGLSLLPERQLEATRLIERARDLDACAGRGAAKPARDGGG